MESCTVFLLNIQHVLGFAHVDKDSCGVCAAPAVTPAVFTTGLLAGQWAYLQEHRASSLSAGAAGNEVAGAWVSARGCPGGQFSFLPVLAERSHCRR